MYLKIHFIIYYENTFLLTYIHICRNEDNKVLYFIVIIIIIFIVICNQNLLRST